MVTENKNIIVSSNRFCNFSVAKIFTDIFHFVVFKDFICKPVYLKK